MSYGTMNDTPASESRGGRESRAQTSGMKNWVLENLVASNKVRKEYSNRFVLVHLQYIFSTRQILRNHKKKNVRVMPGASSFAK